MPQRKQFQEVSPPDATLMELLEQARATPVGDDVLHEQRISFAFGNSPESEYITKDSVRRASTSIRLEPRGGTK